MDGAASIQDFEVAAGAASPPIAIPSSEAQRCLSILTSDRLRCGGELPPERVDSLAEKRELDAADRAWLYQQLDMGAPDAQEILEDEDAEIADELAVEEKAEAVVSEDPVTFLLRSVNGTKLLTPVEERVLGRQIRNGINLREGLCTGAIVEDGGVQDAIARAELAKQRMVLSNIRLVVSIAKKYQGWSSLDFADVVQEGIVGLMRAIDKFDPEMGLKLSTYASWWIRQSITRAIHDTGKTIRFPVHVAEKIAKLRRTQRRLQAASGEEPSIAKLAAELGWKGDDTEEIFAHSQMGLSSIDDEGEDDDGRAPLILVDTSLSPHDLLEQKELTGLLKDILASLPQRECEVIERRFGFDVTDDEEETLAQIGEDYGVTRERIRQIEAKALRRLRLPGRIKPLLPYKQEGTQHEEPEE